ncbi:hypothetical protein TW95_gp0530 [Pandoravirus inopinatum]|uniref:Uncharacterized protein n=1 Tax=Pandoravirus inopinatum TaxID=1605721 RepID=A0A0B5J1B4_9VIRU|nr:hypothetical protein TW95_gp0530 [Pandoravirus inopinatum]AJF97264.1 hypothetical protein [Pandoravirus inopinatum]
MSCVAAVFFFPQSWQSSAATRRAAPADTTSARPCAAPRVAGTSTLCATCSHGALAMYAAKTVTGASQMRLRRATWTSLSLPTTCTAYRRPARNRADVTPRWVARHGTPCNPTWRCGCATLAARATAGRCLTS